MSWHKHRVLWEVRKRDSRPGQPGQGKLPEEGPALGCLPCCFKTSLFWLCLLWLAIFQPGDVDREIIHVSISFSNLMDQMGVMHNSWALGVGCEQDIEWWGRAKGYFKEKFKHLELGSATTWCFSEWQRLSFQNEMDYLAGIISAKNRV